LTRTTIDPHRADWHVPRRVATIPLVVAMLLLPWSAYLALSLPAEHTAAHWNGAWAGFDIALACAFGATAWAVRRRRELLAATLLVTATVMLCDSWFDVATALGTPDQRVALLEAAIEVPLALCLGCIALRERERPARAGRSVVPEHPCRVIATRTR
jgi:hypothetical protein